jgi:hypothetical protein
MTRYFRLIATLLVAAAATACSEIVPEAADSPVGPVVQLSESDAGAAVAPPLGVSTTCQSFRKELDAVNEALSTEANVSELQQKQAALAAIVADVCN